MRKAFILTCAVLVILFGLLSYYVSNGFLVSYVFLVPLMVVGAMDIFQNKSALLKNFPVFGHMRYIAEWMRPKIYQYFVEPDYDGRPFNRLSRNIIYQRAKKEVETVPFGSLLNLYDEGYEWMNHSIVPLDAHTLDPDPRVLIGGKECTKPYNASLLNVSAMSFGSLSSAAIEALNAGAAMGKFAHNTGEGGISPYHLKHGGDLIYQIGTGYFGCRDIEGRFDPELFRLKTAEPKIKMIEIKLSQGAKPGHGGILPGKKVTQEIADIRHIAPFKDVISPPYHSAFSTPLELLNFIQYCRQLSEGKPIGVKLCVGNPHEFIAICKAMVETRILPDFITVDGGEGGTGAAPLEFSNFVGMPAKDGLAFVYNALIGFNLKKEIVLISSGKIATGFNMFSAFALGADVCNSARAMMMALGCIQALECHTNNCPTGVATQNPSRIKGLNIDNKTIRVYNYHQETIRSFVELMAAAGIRDYNEITRSHITRRAAMNQNKRYDEVYPYITEGCLLNKEYVPEKWKYDWSIATPDTFAPKFKNVYIHED